MQNGETTPQERVNKIILGPLERKILPWMAIRLPAWVQPDHLTLIGLAAALLIGISYWLTTYSLNWLWLVNGGLILHWWGDSLDGTLARVRHIERKRYGFFVDHLSDTLSVLLICLGMGISPIMDLKIALLIIIAYYAMIILVCLVTLTRAIFKISFAGIGPTEVRLIAFFINIAVWYYKNPTIEISRYQFTLFSLFGIVVFCMLMVFFLIFGGMERYKLALLDPPKSGVTNKTAK